MTVGPTKSRNAWFMSQVYVHDARLRSYLRRRRVLPHEVQDFCQEAYLRVLDTSARPESSQAFLLRTARNLVVDAIRRRECLRIESAAAPEAVHELTPEREVQGEEDLRGFLCSVEALPPQRRKVYWLRMIEGQLIEQISRQLAISTKTAEAHLTAARKGIALSGFSVQSPLSR